MEKCLTCGGSGVIQTIVEGTGIGCCGMYREDYTCCGNGIPEPVYSIDISQCEECKGTGEVL